VSRLELTHRIVPARQGKAPHPVLLLLHGRGTDENDLLPLAHELDPRVLVVSVRAPFRFPWGGYMWYDLDPRGVGYPDRATLEQSLEGLLGLIERMTEVQPIDPRRVYAAGFSMGAAMSATLALTSPDRVAGAAVLSGYLPLSSGLDFKNEAAAGHPVFQAHGTLDQVIPIHWGRITREYFESTPVALDYHEYPLGHEISYAELQDVSRWLSAVLDGKTGSQ
jgi:phospholipase/carboxylesterase